MKKLLIFMLIFPMILEAKVCSSDELKAEKELAQKLTITYENIKSKELIYSMEFGDIVLQDQYKVKISNFSDNLYIKLNNNSYKNDSSLADENNIFEYKTEGGKYTFHIYSNKCSEELRNVTYYMSKYNYYSNLNDCKGLKSVLKICKSWINEKDYEYFNKLEQSEFIEYMDKYNKGNIITKIGFYINDYTFIFIMIGSLVILLTIYLMIKLINLLLNIKGNKKK